MNKTYKTAALAAVVSIISVALLSCSGSGTATVNISLSLPKNAVVNKPQPNSLIDRVLRLLSSAAYAAPEGVTEIAISVTGPGLSPYEKKFPADTEMVVLSVEAGNDRTFTIKAYDESGTVIYGGSSTVDLKSGETKVITIYMRVPLRMVQDIYTGIDSSSPDELTPFNGKVYFSADDGVNGRELWMYDPSNNSASLVANIGFVNYASDPTGLTVYDNKLFFAANDMNNMGYGRELWYINRANVLCDPPFNIYSGQTGSDPTNLTVVDGKLFFVANGYDGEVQVGREPYVYNGSGDPQLISNITQDWYDSQAVGFASLNGNVYFIAHDMSYNYGVYEYIEPGNAPVIDTFELPVYGLDSSSPVLFNKQLYYSILFDAGARLYTFNDSQIFQVSDVDLIDAANQENLTVVGDNLYFPARDDESGLELWSYNGVYPPELYLDITNIADINSGTGDSSPSALTPIDGLLYFGAYAGGEVTYLYRYDPGNPPAVDVLPSINGIADIRKVGNVIAYLDAPDQGAGSVWIYDPAKPVVEGTNPFSVTDSISVDSILLVQGNRLYLSGNDGVNGTELWVYDYYE